MVRERKILEVHITKGMKDGQKITFSGEGDQVYISSYLMELDNPGEVSQILRT